MSQFQVDKYLDAIKQIGTANSAGLFGGAVALYYFKDRAPGVLLLIKIATAVFLFGVIMFAIAYCLFLGSITAQEPIPGPPDRFREDAAITHSFRFSIYAGLLWLSGTFAAGCVLYLL